MKLLDICVQDTSWKPCRKVSLSLLSAMLMLFSSQFAFASEDVAGAREADFLPRYPNSVISHFSEILTDDYTLYTSSLKKVNGIWRADRQRSLVGDLLRLTYLIPDGHNLEMVSEFYQKQIEKLIAEGGKEIFHCEKRGCGSSNQWANMVFGIKELYGSDRDQLYRVDRFDNNGQAYYLAFYLIERGSRRIYAHLDLFALQQEGEKDVMASLRRGDKLVVLNGEKNLDMRLQQISAFMKAHTDQKLYIVGHSYGDLPLASLQAQSKKAADVIAQRLAEEIDLKRRVEVYGVGPLAPQSGIATGQNRVELIPF